ncbi:MAG: hypothetical protein ACI857_002489 [Arenicella sp.]|jgi:hypothetical protein
MFKKLSILTLLLASTISFGQSAPTLYSVEYDTLCNNDIDKIFITITIEDLDMDSTYISNVVLNNLVLDGNSPGTVVSPPTWTGTETLREFTVTGTPNFNSSGLFMADVTFEVTGAIGVEGPPVNINLTDIPVYGEYIPDLTTQLPYFCSNDLPLDLGTFEVNSGGFFSWANGGGNVVESNTFDPVQGHVQSVEDFGEYYIYYENSNSAGCSGSTSMYVTYNDPAEASMAITPSSCENADGQVDANIFNGLAPYDVYWTTGFSEQVSSISSISNLSSGVYYLNIEDDNGCKSVINANVADSDLSITAAVLPQLCQGATGSVDLSVSSSGTVTSVYWSNGQTTTLMNAPAGEYSVQVHTDNNCNFFGTYVVPDSSLGFSIDSYWNNSQCFTTPGGSIAITTFGGSGVGTYNWDWQKNSSTISTSEDLFGIDGGIYECTLSDGNGCSLVWDKTILNNSNVYLWADEVVKSTCGNSDGEIDVFIDTFGDVPATYEWDNGTTTEDLIGVGSGTYTLTYTDQAGCENYLTVEIIDELPYQPSICLLTVDLSLTYNQIVWEKVPGEPIDVFNIYRETASYGEFELVNTRDFSLESFFMDNSASPIDRSWRYAVTTVDACGNESNKSFIHKTIHTVANTLNSVDYTITWDDYEGISYSEVELFRFDNTNGWTSVGIYPAGTNSAPDTPPVLSGLDYYVSFILTDGCTSTKATDYNSSRSNKADSAFDPGGSTVSIKDNKFGLINIYPNPTSSIVNIFIEEYDMYEVIELRDMNGRILSQKSISNQNEMIDLTDYASGVYFISIISGDESHQQKIVKK